MCLFKFVVDELGGVAYGGDHRKDDSILKNFLYGGVPNVHQENGYQKEHEHPVKECTRGYYYPF